MNSYRRSRLPNSARTQARQALWRPRGDPPLGPLSHLACLAITRAISLAGLHVPKWLPHPSGARMQIDGLYTQA